MPKTWRCSFVIILSMPGKNAEFDDFFKELDAQEQDVLAELEKESLESADEDKRAIYKSFGKLFVVLGGAVFAVALAEQILNFQFFNGRVYDLSLFIVVIGVLLWRS